MRLERLNNDKIKIFLTFDDLVDRGLSKEDLWHDSLKVHQLFRDMIEEASDELGFVANGPIAVEVYSLQAQGMVVIVTKDVDDDIDFEDEDFAEDYIEMQVTLDESDDIFYEFQTFEDVIQLSTRLNSKNILSGTLYSYNNRFYLLFETEDSIQTEDFVSILAEFGSPSTITTYKIEEYGKKLIKEEAINKIFNVFINKSKNL
jgi:adapter protein MecA 1/2